MKRRTLLVIVLCLAWTGVSLYPDERCDLTITLQDPLGLQGAINATPERGNLCIGCGRWFLEEPMLLLRPMTIIGAEGMWCPPLTLMTKGEYVLLLSRGKE